MICHHCYGIGYDASGYPCTCRPPAKVARVGRKYRTTFDDPVGKSPWRRQLKDLARFMLVVLGVAGVSALALVVIR